MSYLNHVVGPMKVLDNFPSGVVVISQVEGSAVDLGQQKIVKSSGGQVYRTFTALLGAMPKFSGTTEAIAQFLGGSGATGKILATGIELYNQLPDAATGLRASGSSHEKFAFAACLLVPRTLSCSHKSVAKLSFEIFGVSSDGTTHPITLSSGVALPTITGVLEQFTLGPVKINGTAYEGVQDLTIDFGLAEVLRSGGKDLYTKLAYLGDVNPKITIKTDEKAMLAALGLSGLAQSATDSVIFLTKIAANGTRVADATTEHISFTIDDGLWLPTDKGGSHPGQLMTSFECEPTYDGTNLPMVISVAAAIA